MTREDKTKEIAVLISYFTGIIVGIVIHGIWITL